MEIEQLRELKAELDYAISKLVVDFENQTEMQISSVVVKRIISNDDHTISVHTCALID